MLSLNNLRLNSYGLSSNCFSFNRLLIKRLITTSQLKEYYAILNVNRSSTPKEIKESFLKLSKVYHPDNKDTGSHTKFVKLKEAYDAIKDGSPTITATAQSYYKPPPSSSTSSYTNYDDYSDLNQRAHQYYRHKEYQNKGFGGPFANSQTPWDDYKKAREAHRRYQQEQNPFNKGGKSLISVTVIISALAWMVMYSGVLILWENNDRMKKEIFVNKSRNYEDYVAFKEYMARKEADLYQSERNMFKDAPLTTTTTTKDSSEINQLDDDNEDISIIESSDLLDTNIK